MKTPKPLKPRLLQCQTLVDKGCCLLPCGAYRCSAAQEKQMHRRRSAHAQLTIMNITQ